MDKALAAYHQAVLRIVGGYFHRHTNAMGEALGVSAARKAESDARLLKQDLEEAYRKAQVETVST